MGKSKTMPALDTESYLAANAARLELNLLLETSGENIVESEKGKAIAKVNEALEAVNADVKKAEFEKLLLTESPVLAAIKAGKFDLYKLSSETEDNKTHYEFTSKMYIIDLDELSEAATTGIFKNAQWKFWVEKLNHAVYDMKAKQLEIKPENRSKRFEKWKISSNAKELSIANFTDKNGNVTKSGATKAIQAIFDAIYFESSLDGKGNEVNFYKLDGRDVTALLDNYSKWSSGKINGIVFPNDDTFRIMLMRIFHRVVVGGEYGAE